jgi:putative transcriptional regulator
MGRSYFLEFRHIDPAPLHCVRAARVEVAARRRRYRAGHVALQDDALALHAGFRHRRSSQQGLAVRMQGLAEAVGVSRQSINSIERERYVPSLMLALTFAKVFNCATDDIFIVENEA